MTLQPLNSITPDYPEARGFLGPYVRVATHLGYCIAWVSATTDEEWSEPLSEATATQERVKADLQAARNHLAESSNPATDFVGDEQSNHMAQILMQIVELSDSLPQNRSEAMVDIQTLANNLAYAAAMFEYHVTGNRDVSEGRNA